MQINADTYQKLIEALEGSVRRNLAPGLLLSGGLDTSVLAYLVSNYVKPSCYTVALKGARAPDVGYAQIVARRLGLNHHVHYFGEPELYEAIKGVVKVMRSFDPMEVRNSASIYVALKAAKGDGVAAVMTGDGCDELLAGYSFLFHLGKEGLDLELEKLWQNMRFSSTYLGEELDIGVRLPYLDPLFKPFAMGLDSGVKVREEGGRVWGKWILRKAFEPLLPQEIAWREKAPIELGSGTSSLTSLFNSRMSDPDFDEKKAKYFREDKVALRDKEHLFYYEVYRSVIGIPRPIDPGGRLCPYCNSNIEGRASYCRTCGAYPVSP